AVGHGEAVRARRKYLRRAIYDGVPLWRARAQRLRRHPGALLMAALRTSGTAALWVALLTAASSATTLALACATPFPALAALAAVHMRRRDGLALMLLAWAASQVVGFALLGYPRHGSTLAWGAAL